MVYCFIYTLCSSLRLTIFLWISVVCIEEFEWKRDYELDDRTVTSHMISCHDVTTVTECLKDCSSLKLCHSVFLYKPDMSCCLNKKRVYTASDTQTAPGHVHYVSSHVAGVKAKTSQVAAAPSTAEDDTTTELTSTTDVITTTTTATTTTTSETTLVTTASTTTTEAAAITTTTLETTTLVTTTSTTTEATAIALSDGFINVPSIPLTFQVSSTGLPSRDAQGACQQKGGHLIYLNTAAKQSYIINHLSNTGISAEFYFGAYMMNANSPIWLNGTAIVSPPWAPGEPHNNAKCICLIIPSGQWKDDDCTVVKQYICEK